MTYTAISAIVMDICVVEDRIVSRWKLQCCRMAVTVCQRLVKLFRPTWQRHHLMIASIIVTTILQPMTLPAALRAGTPNASGGKARCLPIERLRRAMRMGATPECGTQEQINGRK